MSKLENQKAEIDNGEVMRVHSAEKDNIAKALLRNLNFKKLTTLLKRGANCYKTNGAEALWREVMFRVNLMLHRESWEHRADIPLRKDLAKQRNTKFVVMPLISIVVPVYNTPSNFLKDCIKSCTGQSYNNLELVLADASDDKNQKRVKKIVDSFKDKRIVYVKLNENKGISENTNIGLQHATGRWITLLDHDDKLQKNAMFEICKTINESNADFIYSDEIVLNHNMKKLVMFHFKPDFSPDTLRGCNYITHLSAFSKNLLDKVGHFNPEFDGAQDFDLILRLTEKAQKIAHIPKVLYFWRGHANSTASGISTTKPYAIQAGVNAVKAQLNRLCLEGNVTAQADHSGSVRVKYAIVDEPLISIIIPNKDHIEDLDRVLTSLKEKAGYDKYEIIIVENNSTLQTTLDYYKIIKKENKKIKVIKYTGGFNFSAINNYAVKYAKGKYLLLLNNDMEILSKDFLPELLSYAQRSDVGAVGAKLLYPDDTIQHAGVIVGIGGTAGHSHKSHPAKSGGDMYRLATTQNYLAVTGACLMVKTELYEKLGGLDETRFAVAFNDVDFCLRLHKQGYLNVFTPFATAYHYESKSRGYDDTGANQIRYNKEREFFTTEYADILKNGDMYYNPHFTYLYENYGYK